MWFSLVTTVCLLVLTWIYDLNYHVNQLGINFSKELQKKAPALLLGFLRYGHPLHACYSLEIYTLISSSTPWGMRKRTVIHNSKNQKMNCRTAIFISINLRAQCVDQGNITIVQKDADFGMAQMCLCKISSPLVRLIKINIQVIENPQSRKKIIYQGNTQRQE